MAINNNTVFTKVYNDATTVVAYDPKWANGTGYLNDAVRADLGLRAGDIAKSVDDHGRRILLAGTRFGNVVIFDRYSGQDKHDNSAVFVSNVPSTVRVVYSGVGRFGTDLGIVEIEKLLDVGNVIERLMKDRVS